MPVPDKLSELADRVRGTGHPHVETVRTLLSWFGQQRRGRWVVTRIRNALREVELVTEPDFEMAYIDGAVQFKLASSGTTDATGGAESTEDATAPDLTDPVARIRMLAAANRRPLTIQRDKPVSEAVTLMLMNDYSQLPVMSNDRNVQGIISWRSIGRVTALNRSCQYVRDCMERAVEVPADMPLLNAISLVVENEVVLVRERDQQISGLVTTSDVSIQFKELAEPFLLVGEIENHLRRLIESEFTAEELAAARDPADDEREVAGVEDLTFGEYGRLLENRDNWARLGINLERAPVVHRLQRVRDIRNDVMHFSPDGISPEDLEFLRDTVSFFQRLQ